MQYFGTSQDFSLLHINFESTILINKENPNTKANIRNLGFSHRIIEEYTFKEMIDWNKYKNKQGSEFK